MTSEEEPLWESAEYRTFHQRVAQKQATFVTPQRASRTARYFDAGPAAGGAAGAPLVLLPGLCGTAESFYAQLLHLGARGYRAVAVESDDALGSVAAWVDALDGFLAFLGVGRVHLFGAQLGGFLAQMYAAARPHRVASLALCNTFCDTAPFADASSVFVRACGLLPAALLRRRVSSALVTPATEAPQPPAVRRAAAFMARAVEQQSFAALHSKYVLNCTPAAVPVLPPSAPLLTAAEGRCVTVIYTADESASAPPGAVDDVLRHYPRARAAPVRGGGDFPYLACPDEVNLILEVHLKGVQFARDEAKEALRKSAH